MAALTLLQSAAIASTFGIVAHLGWFIHGEHHRLGIYYLSAAVFLPCVSFYGLLHYADFSLLRASAFTTTTWWSFVLSLFASMLVYRASPIHRLSRFPGPYGAKLTKFWHARKAVDLRWYADVNKLHAQYGDYLRTGPNEISIADPAAVELIHGARTVCKKSPWYDLAYPRVSLQFSRNKAEHDKRRRVAWERAFNAKALRAYDETVVRHADELLEGIKNFDGKPVNVSKWFNYFTADTMSALGFGTPFNMLRDAKDHWTITVLQEGSKNLAFLGPTPWLMSILIYFPFLAKANERAKDWSIAQIEERKKRKVEEGADIMAWLLDPLEPMSTNPKIEAEWLHGDARLAIIAGTDTSTAALSYISYHLAKDPGIVEKIREELIQHGIDKEFSVKALQDCEYLQAIIDETMRLHPPVPDGVYRMTPPEGLQIGDHFIPGEVTIIMPTYTVHRSPAAFSQPLEYIPERWTSRPELIKDKKAFMPFNVGTYSCVGKQLALNEIRTVISKLVLAFDIAFAPGEDGTDLLEKTEDYFVLGLADFMLCFTPRKV